MTTLEQEIIKNAIDTYELLRRSNCLNPQDVFIDLANRLNQLNREIKAEPIIINDDEEEFDYTHR